MTEDDWFVRVGEKEYGPATLETLLEWKADGRLIPQNHVRRAGESQWTQAAEFPELFATPPPLPDESSRLFRRRNLGQVFSETLRIYTRGFWKFFVLALFVAVPSLGFKLALAYVHVTPGATLQGSARVAAIIAVLMFSAVLVTWPIFVGAVQFATHDLARGRGIQLGDVLHRTVQLWPRIGRLCVVVYGSYIFWTALPLLAILTLAATQTLLGIFVALLALAFQVYMAGRLFINFMFWQQSCTIGELDGIDALRESKDLARSRRSEPPMQRPLYRGALIASLWLLVLLGVSIAIELPFTVARFSGITNFEDAFAMMQSVMNAPAPDAMMIATYVLSSLVHAALRPLLAIAFVVLYFDAKAG